MKIDYKIVEHDSYWFFGDWNAEDDGALIAFDKDLFELFPNQGPNNRIYNLEIKILKRLKKGLSWI